MKHSSAKKIFFIASAAFAFLAACYAARSSYLFLYADFVPKDILQSGDRASLLNYLATHGKHVKKLDLSEFSKLKDQDLKTISEQCPELQKLKIRSKQVTDEGFQHLQFLKFLQSLNLTGCSLLTSQQIQQFQSQIPGLKITL